MNNSPLLMGILNVTPDSFFDMGLSSCERAVEHGLLLQSLGANIIDIGGESTRPGALAVEEGEELKRVLPVIETLAAQVHIPLSIDTYKPNVAKEAVKRGAKLINDVTGFTQREMREVAASCDADLCVMHMLGTPRSMQNNPVYPEGVLNHVLQFFEKQITALAQMGVKESRIILDPGIGFGKTIEDNLILLNAIDRFKSFGLRVLIGASRKWFIRQILNKSVEEALAGTLAVHHHCLLQGVDILRVHDVAEHRDMLKLSEKIRA